MIALLVATQIARVIVYPDRAQVTRTAQLACTGSAAAVSFAGLPPGTQSGRATTSEGAVMALDISEDALGEGFGTAALDTQLRALEAQLAALQDERAHADDATRVAGQLAEVAAAQVSTEMATEPAPDVKSWRSAFEQTLQARLVASQERAATLPRERELRRKQAELRQQRARLGQAAERRERRARVLVSCPSGRTAQVELTYQVGAVSWQPAYEARAGDKSVSLSLFATVRQATGESWEGAQLVLSTALPSSDATPPELGQLRVFADPREPPKKVLVRRDEVQRHAEAGANSNAGATGMNASDQGLSVQLAVKGAADVAGDSTPARLFVGKSELPAEFALRTVPRQIPYFFHVAELVNGAPYPLLPGKVELFRRGGYLGTGSIERVPQGGRFHLSFGLEEGIKVKRIVLDEIKRDTGLFKNNQRFHYSYRYELESSQNAAVELAEQVPVSELDDVQVELEDQTTPGYEQQPLDGILRWKLSLKAGEKKQLNLAFHVDVPSSYQIGF